MASSDKLQVKIITKKILKAVGSLKPSMLAEMSIKPRNNRQCLDFYYYCRWYNL